MSTLRNLSLGLSLGLHLAAIGGLVFFVRPDSGAKFAAPPTIELMLPPMAVAAASSVAPVEAAEVTPVEATEVTPPETLPVMAEAVEAIEPVVAVAAEAKPEPPKPQKPKPRERAERPKKPTPAKETVESPTPAPPQAVAAVATPGTSAVAGGGNPGAKADFKALVSAWIERHKRFPDRLRRRGLQGTPVVRFRLTRDGRVTDCRIERQSPHDGIDEAAMDTIRRAEPFPAMPDDVPGETMEFTVPIAFNLR